MCERTYTVTQTEAEALAERQCTDCGADTLETLSLRHRQRVCECRVAIQTRITLPVESKSRQAWDVWICRDCGKQVPLVADVGPVQ